MMVENMCRACLLSEDNEISFQNMKIPFMDSSTIGVIFSRISTIQHDPNDGLPQKICQKCLEQLSSSYEFQKKCIQSDIEIRNLLGHVPEFTATRNIKIDSGIKIETGESELEAEIDDWIIYSDDEKPTNVYDCLAVPITNIEDAPIERPNPKNKRKSRYKCEICNKVFDRNSSFLRHLKSHKPGEVFDFECEICNCKFTKEKNLSKHLKEKHTDSTEGCFPCPHCPRKFLKKASRSAHMQCHKAGSTFNIEKYEVEEEEEEIGTEEVKLFGVDVKPLEIPSNDNNQEDNQIKNNIKNIKMENFLATTLTEGKEEANDDDSDEVELPNPKNRRKAIHECEVCQKKFDRKYRLQRHLNIHNPEGRPFECPVCKWRFASEQNLTRHAIMHTAVADCIKQNDEKPKVYRCLYCPRKFAKKESLASHMRVHKASIPPQEAQERNFKCQFCPKAFYKITSLTRHLYTHDDEKDFKCNLCDKSFSLRGQLVDHMNWHKGIKPFRCEICTKSFNQSCTLKDHMRTHSGEKPFLCSECGKGFNNSSNLRQHTLRHSGDKPFKCSECPSSFTSKGGLKSHMSTHTKLKPHVCDTCGSSFTKRYSLKKHKRIHTGEKPYECSTCHMRFTSSNHLKRHIRTHTGEKPYACKYCERAFAQSNDLVKHLKSHLGDKIYKCDRCGESFRLHTELRDHQYQHYREEKQLQEQLLIVQQLKDQEMKVTINVDDNVNCGPSVNCDSSENCNVNPDHKAIVLKSEIPESAIYPMELQYQCSNCDSIFSTPENLHIHVVNEHNIEN